METPCKYPAYLSLDVLLPLFVNKCQKGKRMHARNYSSEESSELELFGEAERVMVEAKAGVGVATWVSGSASEVAARGASGLYMNVPAVSSSSSSGSTNSRSVEAER
jgi:hypothetical protein